MRSALVAAVVVMSTAGCGGGLEFAKDARVKIVSPRGLATVTMPVRIRWTSDLSPVNAPLFAVFVDGLPVHPGQNLRSLAGPTCASVPGCVDMAWLNRHHIFVTAQPSIDLDALPILAAAKGERDLHQVTIVLVDGGWQRIGESAWNVTFGVRPAAAT